MCGNYVWNHIRFCLRMPHHESLRGWHPWERLPNVARSILKYLVSDSIHATDDSLN